MLFGVGLIFSCLYVWFWICVFLFLFCFFSLFEGWICVVLLILFDVSDNCLKNFFFCWGIEVGVWLFVFILDMGLGFCFIFIDLLVVDFFFVFWWFWCWFWIWVLYWMYFFFFGVSIVRCWSIFLFCFCWWLIYVEGGGKFGFVFVNFIVCVGRLFGVEGVEKRIEVVEREWYEGSFWDFLGRGERLMIFSGGE